MHQATLYKNVRSRKSETGTGKLICEYNYRTYLQPNRHVSLSVIQIVKITHILYFTRRMYDLAYYNSIIVLIVVIKYKILYFFNVDIDTLGSF